MSILEILPKLGGEEVDIFIYSQPVTWSRERMSTNRPDMSGITLSAQ